MSHHGYVIGFILPIQYYNFLKDWLAAHPVPPSRLCHCTSSRTRLAAAVAAAAVAAAKESRL
jgi:hypothetical protein